MAEDTNITVLAPSFNYVIPCSLYQKVGTRNRKAHIDINKIASKIGKHFCTALIGIHDTVSTFAGKGKMGTLNNYDAAQSAQRMFQWSWPNMGCFSKSSSQAPVFHLCYVCNQRYVVIRSYVPRGLSWNAIVHVRVIWKPAHAWILVVIKMYSDVLISKLP